MKYFGFILFVFVLFLVECASSIESDNSYSKMRDGFIEVKNIKGRTLEEANENAKYKILEVGLNKAIQIEPRHHGDFRFTREELDQYPVDKYIRKFSQIGSERSKDGLIEIDARARLNLHRITSDFFADDSFYIQLAYSINEKIEPINSQQKSLVKNLIVHNFPEFHYADSDEFQKFLEEEGIKLNKILNNPRLEDKTMKVAMSLGVEILLLGNCFAQKKRIGEEDNWHISLDLKFLDLLRGKIIVSIKTEKSVPANQSLVNLIDSIIKSYRIPILRKVREGGREKPIILKIAGINIKEFLETEIINKIEKIRGVDLVIYELNLKDKNSITLEVEANFNGIVLYQKLREKRVDMGIDFKQKIVKPELVEIEIIK